MFYADFSIEVIALLQPECSAALVAAMWNKGERIKRHTLIILIVDSIERAIITRAYKFAIVIDVVVITITAALIASVIIIHQILPSQASSDSTTRTSLCVLLAWGDSKV